MLTFVILRRQGRIERQDAPTALSYAAHAATWRKYATGVRAGGDNALLLSTS